MGALALAGVAVGGVLLFTGKSDAADHRDGPTATADPASDITDIYAWMTPDATTLNLVLNTAPFAAAGTNFSDAVQYVFHVNSSAGYGMPQTETTIICTFETDQTVQCWVGDSEYVTGDASAATGLTSASGKVKVFAGLRNDPFFFNLDGFKRVAGIVKTTPGIMFDGNGCPMLDPVTSMLLVDGLKSNGDGSGPGTDTFATANVLSLVVQVDKTLVNSGGRVLGVWGSTNAR